MLNSGRIRPIGKSIVHKICSGQAILDLSTAVKELVENALDAGATNIEVRLKEHGSELIEVADNGEGISPSDYPSLSMKYHTSKLQDFTDLQELNTFGFRGEALSSLCCISEVSIVTRQDNQAAACKLEYDHEGVLKNTSTAARSRGTTVSVKNIFSPQPVRHKEFKRHLKREFAKMVVVLQAYALISVGVRIICTNQAGSGSRTTIISTQGASSIRENVVKVFDPRTADGLEELDAPAGDGLQFYGFISKGSLGTSRATGDRQFLFLNGRPVDIPKMSKIINESFKSLASPVLANHKPMFIIDIRAPKQSYDINVTPDKRKVFLQEEHELLSNLQTALNDIWEPSRSRYQVGSIAVTTQPSPRPADTASHKPKENDPEEDVGEGSENEPDRTPSNLQRKVPVVGSLQRVQGSQSRRCSPLGVASRASSRGIPHIGAPCAATPTQPLISRFVSTVKPVEESDKDSEDSDDAESSDAEPWQVSRPEALALEGGASPALATSPVEDNSEASEKETKEEEKVDEEGLMMHGSRGAETPGSTVKRRHQEDAAEDQSCSKKPRTASVASGLGVEQKRSVPFDLQSVRNRWEAKCQGSGRLKGAEKDGSSFNDASLQGADSENLGNSTTAEAELERIFQKSSFRKLQILGQFNLGFILARLGQDLFIIDQHASDEKFNFERLTRTTQLNRQPLLVPQPMDLTPAEAIIIREHMHIFNQNGFGFKEGLDGSLLMSEVPHSKNMTFGKADVQELAQLLLEQSTPIHPQAAPPASTQRVPVKTCNRLLRPSRVRAMLAMRACRSSIMIGKTLDKPTMRKVVDNLADLDSPWNCPHGRPTMRHLAVLP